MRRLHLPALILAIIAGCLAAPPAALAATWDMASPYADDDFRTRSAQALAASVSNASGGNLTLVVFGNGSLVAPPQIPAAVKENQIPIAMFELTRLADEAPVLAFSSLPLLAATYDESLRLWNAARPVVRRLLAERGLMAVYALPAVPANLFTRGPVSTLPELQRLPVASGDRWLRALIGEMGGTPVEADAAGLRQVFASGRARAMLVPPGAAILANAWDVVDNAYDVQVSFPLSIVAVNQNAFYALDEESQRALLNAAVEAQNDAWSRSVDTRNAEVAVLDARRLIVQPSPPPLQDGLRQAARRVIDQWLMSAGADGQTILAAFGWPRN